jgi:hypothetical protein
VFNSWEPTAAESSIAVLGTQQQQQQQQYYYVTPCLITSCLAGKEIVLFYIIYSIINHVTAIPKPHKSYKQLI